MKKVNVNDEFVRRAIWEINNHRCFYTGNPLEYSDMELDHIIPSKYRNMPDELKKLIYECGLEEDFEIDSLYNLVPTTKFNNRRKSDKDLQLHAKLCSLSLVREKVPQVIKRIEQLKNRRNCDEHLAMLKTLVDEQEEKTEREKLLNEILGFISNENSNFDELEEILNKDKEQIFRKYTKRIGLEAIMPKYNDLETTCVLFFRSVKVSKSILILSNKIILSKLFIGLFTDPKYGCREFIEAQETNQHNQEILDLDNTIIHIGNSKLKLLKNDIYELCEAIDAFAIKYIECIEDIENLLKTNEFPLSKRKNNYKLITITYSEWRQLVEFAFKHDIDKGRSQWHIFDKNANYIKVYTKRKNPNYNCGYHAFFHAEYNEDIVLYPDMTSKELIVTWEFVEDLDSRGTNCINERENWNAEIAYNWFVNEFKPKALGNERFTIRKNKIRETITKNNRFKTKFNLKNEKIITFHDLVEMVSQLQMHYHIHPHNKYRVYKVDMEGIYNSIAICLKNSMNADLFYICSKMHLHQCKTVAELSESILELAANIEDTTINGFGIDFLLRGLLASLESEKINLSFEDIKSIRNSINYFVEVHDREVIFDKYAIEFE